uniref:Uncharacterized protein n=1 Tax=Plectus sambesii TaxID=2011161 RepID=A0A914UYV1_9BILA
MQQTKGLGQFIRNRYGKATDNFLSMDYKLEEIYVRSTDEDRALTSAQAMLSGLFPPQGQQVWDKDIAWQPIPVHSATPGAEDMLLKPTSVACPEYDKIYEEENSNIFNDYNIRYKDFFASISEMVGWPNLNMSNIDDVYSAIYRERTHNLTQPAWVDQLWNGTSAYDLILEMKRITRIADFNSPRKSKILGGYLLSD